jgi:hypothetical protein
VFQTDIDAPQKPADVADSDWTAFVDRCTFDELYFDYTIPDE